MCEIFIVFLLCKKIAEIAKEKGRNPVGYVLMTIGMWIAGEVSGGIAGLMVAIGSAGPNGEPEPFIIIGGALMGAVLGAVVAFVIVNSLSDVRDDYPLRERGYDRDKDRRGEDRDEGRRFGAGGDYDRDRGREDFTAEPSDKPRRDDDRYKYE